jgi:hypothetical protein
MATRKQHGSTAEERARLEYQLLADLAKGLGLHIRIENGSFRSGHCLSQGEALFIINRRLGWAQRTAVLARHLAAMDLDGVALPPAAMVLIEAQRGVRVDEGSELPTE